MYNKIGKSEARISPITGRSHTGKYDLFRGASRPPHKEEIWPVKICNWKHTDSFPKQKKLELNQVGLIILLKVAKEHTPSF